MTPWLFRLYIDAHNTALAYEHDSRVWVAWHQEAFARHKTLPPLKNYLSSAMGEKKKKVDTKAAETATMEQFKAYKREYKRIHGKKRGKK